MRQTPVVCIEPASLAEVSKFLRQEWAAFDRELLGLVVRLYGLTFLQFRKFLEE